MGWCEHCHNTGELDCYCGGDLCVCENYGTYPCPHCAGGDGGFECDEIEDDDFDPARDPCNWPENIR